MKACLPSGRSGTYERSRFQHLRQKQKGSRGQIEIGGRRGVREVLARWIDGGSEVSEHREHAAMGLSIVLAFTFVVLRVPGVVSGARQSSSLLRSVLEDALSRSWRY